MTANFVTDENTVSTKEFRQTVRDEQPALLLPEDGDGLDLLKTWKRQMDRLDMTIDELHEQRFVETATGDHLERLGTIYDIDRKTGENDEKLRKRIIAARNIARSRGTYRDVARAAADVLDTNPSAIELVRPREHGTMGLGIIRVPSQVIDNSPFTTNEMIDLLTDAVYGGHRIQIQESDAFTFGDPNNGFGTEWGRTIE